MCPFLYTPSGILKFLPVSADYVQLIKQIPVLINQEAYTDIRTCLNHLLALTPSPEYNAFIKQGIIYCVYAACYPSTQDSYLLLARYIYYALRYNTNTCFIKQLGNLVCTYANQLQQKTHELLISIAARALTVSTLLPQETKQQYSTGISALLQDITTASLLNAQGQSEKALAYMSLAAQQHMYGFYMPSFTPNKTVQSSIDKKSSWHVEFTDILAQLHSEIEQRVALPLFEKREKPIEYEALTCNHRKKLVYLAVQGKRQGIYKELIRRCAQTIEQRFGSIAQIHNLKVGWGTRSWLGATVAYPYVRTKGWLYNTVVGERYYALDSYQTLQDLQPLFLNALPYGETPEGFLQYVTEDTHQEMSTFIAELIQQVYPQELIYYADKFTQVDDSARIIAEYTKSGNHCWQTNPAIFKESLRYFDLEQLCEQLLTVNMLIEQKIYFGKREAIQCIATYITQAEKCHAQVLREITPYLIHARDTLVTLITLAQDHYDAINSDIMHNEEELHKTIEPYVAYERMRECLALRIAARQIQVSKKSLMITCAVYEEAIKANRVLIQKNAQKLKKINNILKVGICAAGACYGIYNWHQGFKEGTLGLQDLIQINISPQGNITVTLTAFSTSFGASGNSSSSRSSGDSALYREYKNTHVRRIQVPPHIQKKQTPSKSVFSAFTSTSLARLSRRVHYCLLKENFMQQLQSTPLSEPSVSTDDVNVRINKRLETLESALHEQHTQKPVKATITPQVIACAQELGISIGEYQNLFGDAFQRHMIAENCSLLKKLEKLRRCTALPDTLQEQCKTLGSFSHAALQAVQEGNATDSVLFTDMAHSLSDWLHTTCITTGLIAKGALEAAGNVAVAYAQDGMLNAAINVIAHTAGAPVSIPLRLGLALYTQVIPLSRLAYTVGKGLLYADSPEGKQLASLDIWWRNLPVDQKSRHIFELAFGIVGPKKIAHYTGLSKNLKSLGTTLLRESASLNSLITVNNTNLIAISGIAIPEQLEGYVRALEQTKGRTLSKLEVQHIAESIGHIQESITMPLTAGLFKHFTSPYAAFPQAAHHNSMLDTKQQHSKKYNPQAYQKKQLSPEETRAQEIGAENIRLLQEGSPIDFSQYDPSIGNLKALQEAIHEFKDLPNILSKDSPLYKSIEHGIQGNLSDNLTTARGALFELEVGLQLKKQGQQVLNFSSRYKGREFDVETVTHLIECKHIAWEHLIPERIKKLKETLPDQRITATKINKSFQIVSCNPIPEEWKQWFKDKGIIFIESKE